MTKSSTTIRNHSGPAWLETVSDGILLNLYVQPGAAKNELAGEHGDRLKIRIKAPPRDGKANKELCRFLATLLNLSKRQVTISRGLKGRSKDILLTCSLPAAQVHSLLTVS